MSDSLDTLPTDEIPMRPHDTQYMDIILKQQSKSNVQSFMQSLKEPIVYGILFLLLNTPTFRTLCSTVLPYVLRTETTFLFFQTFVFITLVLLYSSYVSK